MIPYFLVPEWTGFGVSVDAEFLLTVAGLMLSTLIARRRARCSDVDPMMFDSFLAWLLFGAFAGGRLVYLFCERNGANADTGWPGSWPAVLTVFRVWDGWRSVGGFFGALLCALLWRSRRLQVTDWLRFSRAIKIEGYWLVKRDRAQPILTLADVALSVFPLAWLFNRVGSALIHDHPGRRASVGALFAVAYPTATDLVTAGGQVIRGGGPRYDLGLLEGVVTLVLAVAVIVMWARPLRAGSYVCICGLTYPPARFALDFLRPTAGSVGESNYAHLTSTQWGFAVLSTLSLALLLRITWFQTNSERRMRTLWLTGRLSLATGNLARAWSLIMCRRVECPHCKKPTYAGCGRHIEQVLGDVPREDRCACRDEPARERAATQPSKIRRWFGL